jgi:hypothetical protein
VNATADQIETLNHALAGFKWLAENHQAFVMSAEVLIDGETFQVERTYDNPGDETDDGYLFVSFR